MKSVARTLVFVALLPVLLACQGRPGDDSQIAVEDMADGGLHEVVNDAMAEALVAGEVSAWIEMEGAPRLDSARGELIIPVKISNDGDRLLSGTGRYPVNLGVQIAGDDGTANSAGGVQDFVRVPLPDLPPGESVELEVSVPADARIEGRVLIFDLVQEGIAWFSTGFEQPVLKAGPFKLCGAAFCDLGDGMR